MFKYLLIMFMCMSCSWHAKATGVLSLAESNIMKFSYCIYIDDKDSAGKKVLEKHDYCNYLVGESAEKDKRLMEFLAGRSDLGKGSTCIKNIMELTEADWKPLYDKVIDARILEHQLRNNGSKISRHEAMVLTDETHNYLRFDINLRYYRSNEAEGKAARLIIDPNNGPLFGYRAGGSRAAHDHPYACDFKQRIGVAMKDMDRVIANLNEDIKEQKLTAQDGQSLGELFEAELARQESSAD